MPWHFVTAYTLLLQCTLIVLTGISASLGPSVPSEGSVCNYVERERSRCVSQYEAVVLIGTEEGFSQWLHWHPQRPNLKQGQPMLDIPKAELTLREARKESSPFNWCVIISIQSGYCSSATLSIDIRVRFLSMILHLFIAAAKKGKPTLILHYSSLCPHSVSPVNKFPASR